MDKTKQNKIRTLFGFRNIEIVMLKWSILWIIINAFVVNENKTILSGVLMVIILLQEISMGFYGIKKNDVEMM